MDEQILCYIDNVGESRFANIDASKVDSWLAAHPDCMPVYQFPVSRDTLRIDQQATLDYRLNCAKLGLSISDLDGVFMDRGSERKYVLVGLRPRNTKYKVIMRDAVTRHYIRTTIAWLRSLDPVRSVTN